MISLNEIYQKYEKIIVWGAGGSFKNSFSGGMRIDYIIDSDETKWGKKIGDGIRIEPPQKLLSEKPEKTVVIICSVYWKEIMKEISNSFDIFLPCMIEPNPFQKDTIYKRGFSLFAEDAIVKGISDRYHININHYIDIGANHPYGGNASFLFYLNGATGCLVEPNKQHIELLKKFRPNDKVINKGVSNKENDGKKSTYYMVKDIDTINTFSEVAVKRYRDKGLQIEEKSLEMISLDSLIEDYGKKINYISIDVEGLEFEILKDFDFKRYDIEIFNIEKSDVRCKNLLLSSGYEKAGETPSNWIFVKEGFIHEEY